MSDTIERNGVSRRKVLLAAAGAAPLLAMMTGGAKAEPTMAQAAVKYQETPKDGKQCDGCNFFVAPHACQVVKGDISPTGYCMLWVKKPA